MWCSLFDVCGLLFLVCELLFVVRCPLLVVRCLMLFLGYCVLCRVILFAIS